MNINNFPYIYLIILVNYRSVEFVDVKLKEDGGEGEEKLIIIRKHCSNCFPPGEFDFLAQGLDTRRLMGLSILTDKFVAEQLTR